jgi:hypothetical protein
VFHLIFRKPYDGVGNASPGGMKKNVYRVVFVFGLFLCLAVVYLAIGTVRARRFYAHAKRGIILSSGMFRFDPVLGFAVRPGIRGAMLFPEPPHIPFWYDKDGFRIPEGRATINTNRPFVLALGDSFTDGFGCLAEETYPYRIAQALGGSELNAALGAYGLAQMLLLARRHIPEYRPDYVLIQYSPWLISRAFNVYAPTDIGKRPKPYFYTKTGTDLHLQPPVFDPGRVCVRKMTCFWVRRPVCSRNDLCGCSSTDRGGHL